MEVLLQESRGKDSMSEVQMEGLGCQLGVHQQVSSKISISQRISPTNTQDDEHV